MKQIFIALFTLYFASVFAQKKIDKGSIDYSIKVESENPMITKMLDGSTATLYFNKKNTMMEMNMGMMKNKTFIDNTSQKINIYLDIMGMKRFIKKELTEEEKKESLAKANDFEFKETDETKVICGHTCKKGIITDKNKNEIIVFYTKDFAPMTKNISEDNVMFSKVNGFLLEYYIEKNGMKMQFLATRAIFEKVDEEKLKEPSGYTETTLEELQNMGM